MAEEADSFDALDMGNDPLAPISDADAFQSKIDTELGEIGDELESLLVELTAPGIAEAAALDQEAVEIRTMLAGAMAVETVELDASTDELRAELQASVDTEAIRLNNETAELARTIEALAPPKPGTAPLTPEQAAIRPFEVQPAVTGLPPAVPPAPPTRPGVTLPPEPDMMPFVLPPLAEPAAVDPAVGEIEPGAIAPEQPQVPPQLPADIAPPLPPSDDFFTIPGTSDRPAVCFNIGGITYISFPGLGSFGPYTITSNAPPRQEHILSGPGVGGPFNWSQQVRIEGPCCDDEEDGFSYTTVFQSLRPGGVGQFAGDACMVVPSCWQEVCPELAEPEIPPEPPVDIEPPVPEIEIPEFTGPVEEDTEPESPIETFELPPELASIVDGFLRGEAFEIPGNCLPLSGRLSRSEFTTLFNILAGVTAGAAGVSLAASARGVISGNIPTMWPLAIAGAAAVLGIKQSGNAFQRTCGENGRRLAPDVITRAFYGLLNNIAPGAFDEPIVALNQLIKFGCPTKIPTAEQALSAWLSGTIDRSTLECWVRGNGFRFNGFWEHVADGARSKPNLADLIVARRRGFIPNAAFSAKARERGWTNPDDVDMMQQLAIQVPGVQDIIRFMVRDVDDAALVQRFQLDGIGDTAFANKFGPQLQKWAFDQGLPEEVMRFQWRAHWRIPSPTQLFTMLHRLGRNPDGSIIPQWRDDIKAALGQDDVLPFWIDPLLDISFSLPRISQIRRLLRSGIFTEAEVKHEFVKRGLETKTAEALTIFEVSEMKKAFRNDPLVAQYAKGNLNETELEAQLIAAGATGDAADQAIEFGKLRMRMNRREKCLAAIRHRVILGEIDQQQAKAEALVQTNDNDQSTELAATWACERDSRSKITTAAELCSFFKEGLIGAGDFLRGLLRINMPLRRAQALVARCQNQLTRSQEKEEERDARKAEAEAKKLAAEATRTTRLSEAQLRQRATALNKANAARDRQQKRIADAAKSIANRNELDYDDLLPELLAITRQAISSGLGNAEEVSTAAQTVSGSKGVSGPISFQVSLLATLAEIGEG